MLLGEIAKIQTGKLDVNAQKIDGRYPFFTCARKPTRIDTYGFDCECVLVAGNGDLNVKYYNGKFDVYQRTYVIEILKRDVLNTRFLYYFLNKYLERLRYLSIGGVIKYIKLGYLTDIKLPKLSIKEQEKIVAALDKAESARAKRKEANRLTDEFLKSVFLEMFGDPIKNSIQLPSRRISEFCKTMSGGTPDRAKSEYFGGGIPWIKSGELKNSYVTSTEETISKKGLKNSSAKRLPINTVLVAMYGATVGEVGLLKIDDATTNQAVAAVIPDKNLADPVYLFYFFQLVYNLLVNKRVGGGQPNISQQIIRDLKVLLPSLDLQQKFADIVQKVEKLKEKQRESEKELDNLFNSLMQRAFKGKLS